MNRFFLATFLIFVCSFYVHGEKPNSKAEAEVITIRKAADRGASHLSWLKSAFTFSFAEYYDPKYTGFRSLRVMNEDRIKGDSGFGSHPHKNMEIITYVMSGALQHKDSMGNTSIIRPGEVQRMRAGSGVIHSEYNPDAAQEVHLYQIWIKPNQHNREPGYAQKSFTSLLNQHKLVLVVSSDGREGSIDIDQDADLYIAELSKGDKLNFEVKANRYAWVQMIKGKIIVNDHTIDESDGLSTTDGKPLNLQFTALENAEFMLFDLS